MRPRTLVLASALGGIALASCLTPGAQDSDPMMPAFAPAAFRSANERFDGTAVDDGRTAFGNTPDAMALAERLVSIDDAAAAAHCELRAAAAACLIYAPELDQDAEEGGEALLGRAWEAARDALGDESSGDDDRLAVGLRDASVLRGIASGPLAESPESVDAAAELSSAPLHGFFTGPTLSPAADVDSDDVAPDIPALLETLRGDSGWEERSAAIAGLLDVRPEGRRTLLREFEASPELRYWILWGIAERPFDDTRELSPIVRKATLDDDPATRASALVLTGTRQDLQAMVSIYEGLEHYHTDVRQAAAMALGALGRKAERAVPNLIAALGDSRNDWERIAIVQALGDIGPGAREALPALDDDGFSPRVRAAARAAATRIGS